LLGGCADLQWSKDGADDATVSRDLDDCTRSARVQAASQTINTGPAAPQVMGVDPQGRAFVANPFPPQQDRFITEHDLQRFCMTGKGYQLVPAER
jgi:hypothetical protein